MFLLAICRLIISPFYHICHRVMFYYERDIADNIYNSTKPIVYGEEGECCFKCCDEQTEENTTLLGNVADV